MYPSTEDVGTEIMVYAMYRTDECDDTDDGTRGDYHLYMAVRARRGGVDRYCYRIWVRTTPCLLSPKCAIWPPNLHFRPHLPS